MEIFSKLKQLAPAADQSNYALNGYLLLLFDELIRQKPNNYTASDGCDTTLQKAIKFISDNFNLGVTVKSLSHYMCMERTTLFKLFKSGIGVSPQQYIITYKLRIAQQYICETNFPLHNIASICGFNNHMHFSRSFTAYFHYSPCEMRKQFQYDNDYNLITPKKIMNPEITKTDEKT